jgi:CRP-like cAMP-binding protein
LRRTDLQAASRATALEPRVALLESLGLFAGASRPVLERLAAAATTKTYPPATAIVREGDPADALYVLAQGDVQVSARGESGGTGQPIEVLRSPAFFGEIGLLEAIPRTATVTALSECRCERIAGEMFLEALTTSPPSPALMETARSRLAVTLPSRRSGSAATARTG